jgi:phosphoribosylanthranilate isomerase
VTEVKFCGMMRVEDVREAIRLGAGFVGVILTTSPRHMTPEQATALLAPLEGTAVRGVGVFGDEPLDEIIPAARVAGCDIVQLHGASPRAGEAEQLRRELGVEVWRVVRVGPSGVSESQWAAAADGDGLLLDTLTAATLGGSGVVFDWNVVSGDVRGRRGGRRLIVAGGLRPDNVREAVVRFAPDVADVSSGVESAPGVKDHGRMAAFLSAVRQATPVPLQ